MEVAQELAVSFQNLAAAYQTAQSYFNRRVATERELALYQYQYEAGTTTLQFVLQAQSNLASAEQSYYTSLSNYQIAMMDLNYRKGSLLDYHNVTLAESDWTPAAYRDAVRDAWARAHAIPANFLRTEPPEVQVPYAVPGAGAPLSGALPPATSAATTQPTMVPQPAPGQAPPPAPPAMPSPAPVGVPSPAAPPTESGPTLKPSGP